MPEIVNFFISRVTITDLRIAMNDIMLQEADKAIYLTGVRARVSLFLEDVTLPNTTLANPSGNGTGTSAAKSLSSADVPRYENLYV